MPLLKGKGCKSSPGKALNYITDKKKADYITSYALDDKRSYAEQFKETAEIYGKGKKYDERKYYHFKHSFDPKDNITPEQAHKLTQELVEKAFKNYECVIATHTDKKHIHSHIVINAVSFENGKKVHLNNKEYGELKDLSNKISQAHGFSTLDFRKSSREKISLEEHHIKLKGGTSWKEELKEVIDEAKKSVNTFEEFENHLKKYGVTIERSTEKTISFIHPEKKKAIRGARLGTEYTKGEILNVISKHRDRTNSNSERENARVEQSKQDGIRKQPTERKLDGVYSAIRDIEDRAKQFSATGREEFKERERPKSKNFGRAESESSKSQNSQPLIERQPKKRDRSFDHSR